MVRSARVEIEGGLYHVYNRVASGEPVFADRQEAVEFVDLIRETRLRDGWTVFAWCVMSNHYHLVLRTGIVPLWRGMHRIQNLFSRRFNGRHSRTGSVWQSRYKAKHVEEEAYFHRLVVYVHTNPVSAGVVGDPADYEFCGHREIQRRSQDPLVAVRATLLHFDSGEVEARRAYLNAVRACLGREEEPDHHGWHPFDSGRKDELLAADRSLPEIDILESSADIERASLDPHVFVETVCELLNVDMAVVCSRARDRRTAAARRLIATLGVERWRQGRVGLARVLRKNADVVSWWAGEGATSRRCDPDFAAELDRLDLGVMERAARLAAEGHAGINFQRF